MCSEFWQRKTWWLQVCWPKLYLYCVLPGWCQSWANLVGMTSGPTYNRFNHNLPQPTHLLLQTFKPFLPELNEDFWKRWWCCCGCESLTPHMVRQSHWCKLSLFSLLVLHLALSGRPSRAVAWFGNSLPSRIGEFDINDRSVGNNVFLLMLILSGLGWSKLLSHWVWYSSSHIRVAVFRWQSEEEHWDWRKYVARHRGRWSLLPGHHRT